MNKKYEKKLLKGNSLVEYKKTLKLSDIQHDIIIGTLLGDASMQAMKGNQLSNIKFEQKIKNKDYIYHLYEQFQDWVGTPPQIRQIIGGNAKDRESIWFRTYRHESFTKYKKLFYNIDSNGIQYKIIPKSIDKLLNDRALAYWFMDDGTLSKNDYYLNTQGFDKKSIELLKQALYNNFKIDSNIHKDRSQYKLYILKYSHETFNNTIKNYILPCFSYKILLY